MQIACVGSGNKWSRLWFRKEKKIGIWVFLAVEIKHGLIKTLRGGTRIRGIMTTSGHLHCKNTFKTLEDKLMVHIFGNDTFVYRKP